MKYNVGDKVRVIDGLNVDSEYPYKKNGDDSTMDVNSEMAEWAGQVVTIGEVRANTYRIRECPGTNWVDSMFVDSPKVSVGDKVKIKSDLSSDDEYFYNNLDDDGEEERLDCYEEMEELAGEEATVTKVDSDGTFKLDIDPADNWWCLSMVDLCGPKDKQVGDRVKVVDNLEDRRYYYTDKNSKRRESFSTYADMRRLSGGIVTISKVDSDGTYRIKEDGGDNWWCDSMFDENYKGGEDAKMEQFYFDSRGYLFGTVVAPMTRIDRVKVIPFIKYDDNNIHWTHSEERRQVRRGRSSQIKDVINKKLQYDKLYDDGDVRVIFKDESGGNDSMYIPECCLMPWDMKVHELPRPKDEYMARAYDAYIRKYEPEALGPVTELEVKDFKATDLIVVRDDIVDGKAYKIRGKIVVAEDIERYKGKKMLFSNCQNDNTDVRFYHDGVIHIVHKDYFTVVGQAIDPGSIPPTEKVELTAELVAKLNTNMTKARLADIYGEPILSSYTKAQIIELIKEKFAKQNKNIMNDESEEIKMSKLGLGGMLTRMFGEVGEVNDGSLALTFAGAVAVRRKDGDFVRYDVDAENIENQGSFILEGSSKFMILMPSPTVAVGDIIKHKGKFLQVIDIKDNGSLSTINFESGTKTTVLKETNLFGMQFYTKVMSMMTGMAGNGTTPGGFNPLMMLILNKDEEGSESKMDMTTMMMLSGMFGGQGATGQMNPMMMLAILGDKEGGEGSGMKDMMMMSMFMGGNSPFGNMFGQATPAQIAEPIKPVDTGLEALCKSQAAAIEQLNKTVAGLTEQLAAQAPADTKTTGKKAAATDK